MHILITTLLLLGIVFLLLSFLVAPGKSTKQQRLAFQNRNIAHRGLHSKDKSIPENSLAAFREAINHGYGIELDVQLTKDNKIVVFHDHTLDRTCQIAGKIDSYTYEELQNFNLFMTNEKIPLFTDVLHLINGKVPLIVELKSCSNNKLLCTQVYSLLQNYDGDYCIESFHPGIVAWFRKNAPHILRGQLSADRSEFKQHLKPYVSFFLSHVITNVIARPNFIAYNTVKRSPLVRLCEFLGAMKVVWTVRDTDNAEKYQSLNDTVIFEYYKPLARY